MNETLLEVLKWVGLALAAGFVGYFGRYLATQLIEKTRRKKPETSLSDTSSNTVTDKESSSKLEKKKAKAEIKKAKKTVK
jgi:hypothetical protein